MNYEDMKLYEMLMKIYLEFGDGDDDAASMEDDGEIWGALTLA